MSGSISPKFVSTDICSESKSDSELALLCVANMLKFQGLLHSVWQRLLSQRLKAIDGPQASDGNIHPLGDVVSTLWDFPKRKSFEIDAGEKEKKNGMGLREKQCSLSQENSKNNQSKPEKETLSPL